MRFPLLPLVIKAVGYVGPFDYFRAVMLNAPDVEAFVVMTVRYLR
jgi:hypothetical protein